MKLHLLLPVKWKTLDERIVKLQNYLSQPDRLGSIYGKVEITYDIVTLPDIKLNSYGLYSEKDILSITKPYHSQADAVGVVFPFVKGEKYGGNYYPNSGTDYKMDFYIKASEKTKYGKGYAFEEIIEHEMAHAVALDLGFTNQGTNTGYVKGADNTHFYFYGKNKEAYYLEVIEQWNKKYGIMSAMLDIYKKILDTLSPKKKPLTSKYWNNVTQKYGIKNSIYTLTGHHVGVDFGCPVGTPIYARCDGEITESAWHSQLGYFLYFKFEGYEERYCHLKDLVKPRKVKKGEIIGYTGNTGFSTAPHLHLDTFKDRVQKLTKKNWKDITVDPLTI